MTSATSALRPAPLDQLALVADRLHKILITGGTFDPVYRHILAAPVKRVRAGLVLACARLLPLTALVRTMPKPRLALDAASDEHQIDPSSKNVPRPPPHRGLPSHRLDTTVTLRSRTSSAGQLPAATGCPFGASHARSTSVRRAANREQMLVRLANSGRHVVSCTVGGERNVLLNHPDHAQRVLGSNRANYSKDTTANRYFRTEVADGILTADGECWRRQRTLLMPVFRDRQRLLATAREYHVSRLLRWTPSPTAVAS